MPKGKKMALVKKGENWYVDYRLPNGTRKREKVGPNKKQAERLLYKRKTEIAEAKFFGSQRKEEIPFDKMVNEYLEFHSKPYKKSFWRDEISVTHLISFFGSNTLQKITLLDVDKYKVQRLTVVSRSTVNREIACLKHIFSKPKEWGKINDNPIATAKLFRVDNKRVRYLEKEEIARLLTVSSGYLKPIIVVALNTGMRKGEILHLKWSDIDLENQIIHITDTKNREVREIPMNEVATRTVLGIKKNPRGPYVFCKKDGTPYKDVRDGFTNALERAAIRNFRFHDLRHTFASHLVMAGIDLKTVQELLGHKTFDMTLRYSHLSPDHKRRAAEVLGRRMDTIWTPGQRIEERTGVAKSRGLSYHEAMEEYAGVAKLADALDSKSSGAYPPCGFNSHLRHLSPPPRRCLIAKVSALLPDPT